MRQAAERRLQGDPGRAPLRPRHRRRVRVALAAV